MSNFNGIVYLTEEQFVTLKTNGTNTVGDATINFDESTLYVTDDVIDFNDFVKKEDLNVLIVDINTALEAILGV